MRFWPPFFGPLLLLSLSCGSPQSAQDQLGDGGPHGEQADGGAEATARPGSTVETALRACATTRSDYELVSRYECPDGSVPLVGNPRSAGQMRRGNVGLGPDGHIVDVYVVPCPSGAVEVFVDAYHCGEAGAE